LSELVLEHLTKCYGAHRAVDDVSLEVTPGSMVALLGPSGCGKTTTLRMIGGFTDATAGKIMLRGQEITAVPPERRDTAMVFQNYALFPHLSVANNIAYGLKRRGIKRAELSKRVAETLSLLRLTELADRRPDQLSGGQQQRVAVGRALIVNPAVLLLDEPFSALDAQLRESTRVELRRLQQNLGITSVFVTHDQEEALSIADDIVVMNDGRVEQRGAPQEIYERPRTRFVASFLGSANLLAGQVKQASPDAAVLTSHGGALVEGIPEGSLRAGQEAVAVIRPEDVTVTDSPRQQSLTAKIELTSFLGAMVELRTRTSDGTTITARGPRELATSFAVGDNVHLSWRADRTRILP
jgi:putative spermidine/putrescine transport system ATP-binding protein